ncbi:hypothetical protein [Saccharothrix sp. Mg75]|uniref:hypothetical protein n=1 Tax=Saccharothrix sp. Mg75 TaxID=3445357 RepID=UPI003EEC95A0
MKRDNPDFDVLDVESPDPAWDDERVAAFAISDIAPDSLVEVIRRLADARDTWEDTCPDGRSAAETATCRAMASAVDDALAALTAHLVDGAAVRLVVPEVEIDTLLTHAVPSLAALCRVDTAHGWFTAGKQSSLTILGGIDLAVDLVRRTRTRATSPADSRNLRSLELRLAAVRDNHPSHHRAR